jgi:hypothetical protein
MILTVICLLCKDHIIIRAAAAIPGVTELSEKSAGVNLVCFTNCYTCDPKLEKENRLVSMQEVREIWMDMIMDLYMVATPTLQLSYCLVPPLSFKPGREWKSPKMPMIWQVDADDWKVASMTHKNLTASLDDILFTLTKVERKVEVVTNGLAFLGVGMTQRPFGNFKVDLPFDFGTRHCLFCVICMKSTAIVVKEAFAQMPMDEPKMINLLFLVCCNACKAKYNPSYTEMRDHAKFFMDPRKGTYVKLRAEMERSFVGIACEDGYMCLDKTQVINSFKHVDMHGNVNLFMNE